MAYDNNTDYMAIMNANQPGSAAYNAAAASRQEKIAAANNQQLTNWGVSVGDATAAKMAAAEAQKQALIAAQKQKLTADLINKRNSVIGGISTQLNNTRTSLENAKNSAISNLETQKAKIAPTYYNMRNSASSQSQLNAKSLAEYMSQRGQTNSNLALQSEMNRQNSLNNQIGSLNQNEAQNISDIEAKKADTANSYGNSIANASTNAAAAISEADKAYVNDLTSAQSGLETTALQDSIAGINKGLDNYRIDAINERNRQDALTQQDIVNKRLAAQDEYKAKRDSIEDEYKNKVFKLQEDLQKHNITVQDYQIEAAKAKAIKDDEQQAWENEYKTKVFNASQNKPTSTGMPTVKDYYNDLQSMITATRVGEGGIKVPAYSQDSILERIQSLPLTPDEKAYLANALGLKNTNVSTSSQDPYYNQGGFTTYLGGR